jgi:hypothetical protein
MGPVFPYFERARCAAKLYDYCRRAKAYNDPQALSFCLPVWAQRFVAVFCAGDGRGTGNMPHIT